MHVRVRALARKRSHIRAFLLVCVSPLPDFQVARSVFGRSTSFSIFTLTLYVQCIISISIEHTFPRSHSFYLSSFASCFIFHGEYDAFIKHVPRMIFELISYAPKASMGSFSCAMRYAQHFQLQRLHTWQ